MDLPWPLGFPCGSAGKESTCRAGDLSLISALGRSPGEGNGYHSNITAWRFLWTTVHGVAKSWTWLSDFHFHFKWLCNMPQLKTQRKLLGWPKNSFKFFYNMLHYLLHLRSGKDDNEMPLSLHFFFVKFSLVDSFGVILLQPWLLSDHQRQ